MLSRLFSGPDAGSGLGPPGHRGRRPQPGDLRLARRLGVQHPRVRRGLPGRRRPAPRRTPSPSTGAPTSASSRPPTTSPPTSTPPAPSCCPLEPKPGAAPGEVRGHGARDLRRRAGLAGRPGDRGHARRRRPEPRWKEIGVLTRDNAHAAAVFDALTDREIPVEIVGLKGLLRLPEVVRGGRHAHPGPGRHRQRRAAHAAGRPALGDRSARPGPARPPGPRARRQPAAAGTGSTTSQASSQAAVEGADPTEIASLCDALEDPGDLAYSAEARGAVRAARRRAAPAARARSASRSSTWSAGSSTPPASTSSWPPR